jgi:hypothetical protein
VTNWRGYRYDFIAIAVTAALLGAALLPAYSGLTKTAADRETCTANLKALYQASLAYAADHDGYLPLAMVRLPAPQVWPWWFDLMSPYVKDVRVFCCPASAKAQQYDVYAEPEPLLPGLAFSAYWVSYGMGYWYGRDNDPRAPYRPSTLQDPANTLLFADACGNLVSSNKGGWNVDPRHGGQVNVVLASGEVVLVKAEYEPSGHYELRRVDDGKLLHWQELAD